jgi:hypothetical protein
MEQQQINRSPLLIHLCHSPTVAIGVNGSQPNGAISGQQVLQAIDGLLPLRLSRFWRIDASRPDGNGFTGYLGPECIAIAHGHDLSCAAIGNRWLFNRRWLGQSREETTAGGASVMFVVSGSAVAPIRKYPMTKIPTFHPSQR